MGVPSSNLLPLWLAFGVATAVKILLLAGNGYRSTDFEVHRNWLAITHSQPVSRWYYEEASEWTLDYPPFFAWFEWVLALFAAKVDPIMVQVENLNYDSLATVYFQRVSVIIVDVAFALGVACCLWRHPVDAKKLLVGGFLLVLNAGLLMVDHIHFQYNGMLLGILLVSCGLIIQDKPMAAAAAFAALLMFKHLYLALAPLYFVYLLRRFCVGPPGSPNSTRTLLTNFIALGAIVLGMFGAAFLPFCFTGPSACTGQLTQIGRRLFPFGRGLVHAYWAPNIWALYLFLDRVLLTVLKTSSQGAVGDMPSTTGGLVHDVAPAVLVNVRPAFTLALTVLACTPAWVLAWRHPRPKVFLWGVVYCAMSSFMLGWHVHEKAILTAIIPLGILTCEDEGAGRLYLRLCALGHFALFPLLPGATDAVTKSSLYVAHLLWSSWAIAVCHGSGSETMTCWDRAGIATLGALLVFAEVLHPAFAQGRMPFLPLLATSVTCGAALMACWLQVWQQMRRAASMGLKEKKG